MGIFEKPTTSKGEKLQFRKEKIPRVEMGQKILSSGLFGQHFDFNLEGGKQQGHERTQPIKYGINSIFHNTNAQYSAMVRSTGVPRHQYRSYGS
jgi:hypothetical protein